MTRTRETVQRWTPARQSQAKANEGAGRTWLALSAVVAGMSCLLSAPQALALSGGISGFSGRDGMTCSFCHSGGVVPVVAFQGPQQVTAGEQATFLFIVQSQAPEQTLAGFNVAASGGDLGLSPSEEGAQLDAGELIHTAPKENAGGEASWEFTWQAPAEPGTETLFGAGLSANGNGNSGGDARGLTTLLIDVTAALYGGDANCDGFLSAADLEALLRLWPAGVPGTCALADADCDTTIGEGDLALVIESLYNPQPLTPCAGQSSRSPDGAAGPSPGCEGT